MFASTHNDNNNDNNNNGGIGSEIFMPGILFQIASCVFCARG
jgi:hypothetical protein